MFSVFYSFSRDFKTFTKFVCLYHLLCLSLLCKLIKTYYIMELSTILIGIGLWVILTFIVCLSVANYIIDKTDKEYLAYLVYPTWLTLWAIGLGVYLNF